MIRWWAMVSVLVLTVAACSAGDDAAGPPTTAGNGPEVTPAATAEITDAVAVRVAPCDLLTAADVEAATGFTVVDVIDDPPLACLFDLGEDAGVDVFVTADDGEGRIVGPAAVFESYAELVAAGDAEAIDGLGETAYFSQEFRGLVVHAGGGRYVGVGVNGGFTELAEPGDVLIALAEVALDRL